MKNKPNITHTHTHTDLTPFLFPQTWNVSPYKPGVVFRWTKWYWIVQTFNKAWKKVSLGLWYWIQVISMSSSLLEFQVYLHVCHDWRDVLDEWINSRCATVIPKTPTPYKLIQLGLVQLQDVTQYNHQGRKKKIKPKGNWDKVPLQGLIFK